MPLLAAAAVAAMAASATPALAEGEITIERPNGRSTTVLLDDLSGSVNGRYTVRRASGRVRKVSVRDGIPLVDVLDAAEIDPYSFGHLRIERPDGGTVVLSRDEIIDPGPLPPVLYTEDDEVRFIRQSAGPGDLNYVDEFELLDSAVTMELQKGAPIQAKIKMSPSSPQPGEEVTFTAVVRNALDGERLSYSWSFGDGDTSSRSEAKHTFSKRRKYSVVLSVTSSEDEAGDSAVLDVTVGEENEPGSGETETTPNTTPAPTTGGIAPTPAPVPAPAPAPSYTPSTPVTPPPTPAPAPKLPSTGSKGSDGLIEGNLLADASTSPGSATASALRAARSGPIVIDEEEAFGLPAAAWALVAALTLLGFGAVLEVRRTRPRAFS
jgi:PKD repeat protein